MLSLFKKQHSFIGKHGICHWAWEMCEYISEMNVGTKIGRNIFI
jgi:hypothetical protein